MADVVLPPLEKMYEPVTPADVEDAQHNAEWATRFAPSHTNFSQRYYANQDIGRHREMVQEQHAAELQNAIQTNKVAQDFFFRSKELEIKEAEAKATLRERDVTFEHALERFPIEQKVRESQLLLNETRQRAALNEQLRKDEAERRTVEHADGLGEHVANLERAGIKPGSPEYFRGVEQGLSKYHFAPPQMHIDLRNAAKIVPRPEDLPVEVTRTVEVKDDDPSLPPVRTERTVTAQKQSRATFEATTPPTGGDFLNRLGLKSATTAPAAPTAQRSTPAPTRPAVTPAPAPDRTAIARKALSDPNASEAHKAAARRILGQ